MHQATKTKKKIDSIFIKSIQFKHPKYKTKVIGSELLINIKFEVKKKKKEIRINKVLYTPL